MHVRTRTCSSPSTRGLFIGGQWREATAAPPSRYATRRRSVITDVADGDVDDAVAALDAAAAAQQPTGRPTAPRERGEILRRAFEPITDQADDFAELISLEMGKTLAEAKGEVTYGAEFFRWFSEEAVRIHGRWMQAPAGGSRLLTIRKPVGPCLFITPWNFPLAMGTRKIGPGHRRRLHDGGQAGRAHPASGGSNLRNSLPRQALLARSPHPVWSRRVRLNYRRQVFAPQVARKSSLPVST